MFARSSKGPRRFDLTGVHTDLPMFTSKITWELPHNIPFEAKAVLIMEYIDRWTQPSLSCFHAVLDFLSAFVEGLLKTHFGGFKNLERHVGYETQINVASWDANTAAIRLVTRAELDRYKER